MTAPRLVLGLTNPYGTGHAVPEDTLTALCGSVVETTVSQTFPAGVRSLCPRVQPSGGGDNGTRTGRRGAIGVSVSHATVDRMNDKHRYDEHVVVPTASTRTINGAVTGGITVQPSATATVNGAFGGRVIVEESGRLTLHGAGSLHEDSRVSGVLRLGGVFQGDLRRLLKPGGRVLVAVGSWVQDVDGTHYELLRDGSLEERPPGNYGGVKVSANQWYRYDPDSQGFVIA